MGQFLPSPPAYAAQSTHSPEHNQSNWYCLIQSFHHIYQLHSHILPDMGDSTSELDPELHHSAEHRNPVVHQIQESESTLADHPDSWNSVPEDVQMSGQIQQLMVTHWLLFPRNLPAA